MNTAQHNAAGAKDNSVVKSGEDHFIAVVPGKEGDKTEADIVAVPAIGADPEKSWVPLLPQRMKRFTKADEPPDMVEPSQKVPSGSQDIDQHSRDTSLGPWPTMLLAKKISQATIFLYDHKDLREGDTLETLAVKFLHQLCQIQARKATPDSKDLQPKSRPLFFICHSTGGLVAKKALILAHQSSNFKSIAHDCFGMTFIATPHQGSAYLSSREFWPNVRDFIGLQDIPYSLRRQFGVGDDTLLHMAEDFKQCSTDLRINTFYETKDSDLRFTPANDNLPRSYRVPIAPASSAIMGLDHESDTPLCGDHVECSTFEGDKDVFVDFVLELEQAVSVAAGLCKIETYPLDLESDVEIRVNGFFKDTASSVKLWTAISSLEKFLADGPRALLEERLTKSQEATEPIPVKLGISSAYQQQYPGLTLTESTNDSNSGRKDKARGRPKRTLKHSLKSLGSSLETQLTQDRSQPSNADPIDNRPILAQRNASVTASVSGATKRIKFAPQGHPSMERKDPIAPSDPGPQLPAMDRLKLTWVHIPYTHTGWVSQVLKRLSATDGSSHLDFLKKEHWASNHNCGRHTAPHAKFVKSSFVDPSKIRGNCCKFAVYLQYLHWDTYKGLVARRSIIERRMEQGRVRPVHQDIKESRSIETKLIWQYLGADTPFHCRRTLDQYGYPNLRSTRARDDDQMLWKRTKPRSAASVQPDSSGSPGLPQDHDSKSSPHSSRYTSPSHHPDQEESGDTAPSKMDEVVANTQDGNVLMVDQLWLWALDEKTIVTFFPNKEEVFTVGRLYQQGDLYKDIYNEVNSGQGSAPDAKDFAALVVQRAATILLDRTAHRHLQVLRIYEESISILIERMTKSFKSFRKVGFSVRPDIYDRNEKGDRMTSAEKEARDKGVEKQSKEDFASLLELRDIYDELHTIKKLFKEQRDTLIVMAEHYIGETPGPTTDLTTFVREAREKDRDGTHGLDYLYETARSLDSFDSQVSDMIVSAENAEKAYSNLLDIKQKQANVDEARLARSQIDANAAQGRSILVFTIFTIIFLPLSFCTSLFGMNVREWSNPGQPLPIHHIVNFIGPISVGVIFIALTLAFSAAIRSCAVIIRKISVGVLADLYKTFSWPLTPATMIGRKIHERISTLGLWEWISEHYLRHTEPDGQDLDIWDEDAEAQYTSPRDQAIGRRRVLPLRRQSFSNAIWGVRRREKLP